MSRLSITASRRVPALAIVVLTAAAYLPALRAGFIWDDESYVTHNPLLQSVDGLRRIWTEPRSSPQYYPLVFTTFWLEYRVWGLWAAGYHAVNVAAHAGAAVLLWLLLRRLGVAGAWLGAAVFALHPVHVESVAWITERKNVLSGLFYFGAALAYLRYARPDGEESARYRDRKAYALAILLFAAALLSKTVTSTLPAAMLVVLWWKRPRIAFRDVVPLVPLFGMGAAAGLTTAWMEKHHVGARGIDWALSPVERCLIAGRAVWFYLGKLVWPANLTFNYPRWEIDAAHWPAYLYPLGVLAALAAMWRLRGRIGRGPLAAVLIFVGTLTPALGFFDVYPMKFSFVADHFQYHASAAAIALLAAGVVRLAARIDTSGNARSASAAAVLLPLAILTSRQTRIYRDLETLWLDTVHKNPASWLACHWLGDLARDGGRTDEAIRWYTEEVRVKPVSINGRHALAGALVTQGRLAEAIVQYEEVLKLRPHDAMAYCNLASHLLQANRAEEAVARLETALREAGDSSDVHALLGAAHIQLARYAEAIPHLRKSLEGSPDQPDVRTNLAGALTRLGRFDEAIGELSAALSLRSDFVPAWIALADAHAKAGRFRDAAAAAEQAAELARRQGDGDAARRVAERAQSYRQNRLP